MKKRDWDYDWYCCKKRNKMPYYPANNINSISAPCAPSYDGNLYDGLSYGPLSNNYQTPQSYTMANTATGINVVSYAQIYYNTAATTVLNSYPPLLDEETRKLLAKEAEERRVKQEAAAKKAEELLFMFIGDKQKEQYLKHGHFDVPIVDKLYRIHKGRSMNIALLEGEKETARYCAHPSDWLPDGDNVLAQFLMLTTDEQKFLKIANKSNVTIPVPNIPTVTQLAQAEVEFFSHGAMQVELAA